MIEGDESLRTTSMVGNEEPIVVQQTYDASMEEVWRAITEAGQMRQWFFETMVEFEPVVGFETTFDVHVEGRVYPHRWRITEVVPGLRIVYDWRYGGFPGASVVVWELAETAEGTRLTLIHQGQDSFPQDEEVFTRESCQGGWEYFLGQQLKVFLGSRR